MSDTSSVKVAVRIRPLVPSEISKGCREIIDVIEENDQIVIKNTDKDKPFTFNYVLPGNTPQDQLYSRCVQPLIGNLFKGYNLTILAYGQTGSGKTHSMGTTYKGEGDMGVIPRAVSDIFAFVRDNFALDFTITVSFMELYQEVLYDLLSSKSRDQCVLEIREDLAKGIHIPGLTEVPVQSAEEILELLAKGSAGRVTGCTNMNSQSSRSHAIFTVSMSINNKDDCRQNKQAKLHLVDLAGSERPKKTGAVGNTFKEGVNINKGLFVLGNVISCLGDEKAQHGFIPYRDSNLTRLLKDSLGGNSITLMIACVSPADYNLEETLSTLRYADRARKIKNKPIVNQDAKVAEINDLKKTIQQLRLQIVGQGGPVICPAEIELLKKQILDLKVKIRDLTLQLSAAIIDKTGLHEQIIILQTSNEELYNRLAQLKASYDITFLNISAGFENKDPIVIKENLDKLHEIQAQFTEINTEQKKTEEKLRSHEIFNGQLTTSAAKNEESSCELQEQQETHTCRQIELNTEIQEIQKQLVMKETLARQLAVNSEYMIDYAAMAENERKIAGLEREKDELLQQLRTAHSQGVSGKISEQRRKRVQALEAQLHDLNRKVQEQARLIKLKEKDEQRILKLNQEITQMKQAKVKLLRTLREESDKFNKWKQQKEREYQRLKQQDKKKENEIVKMKAIHTKQQNVFKRRVEEAEALNKRLKNVLALRIQAQDTKISGKIERIGPWLKQEFDLFINLVEAEATLSALLEDRATLQHQLDALQANPETAESPECKSIEEDIELRSVQIQDLQQKILDSNEDSKAKTRFDKLQTMGEAKFALKALFEQAAEIQKEKIQNQLKMNEFQEALAEGHDKVKNYEEQLKQAEEKHAEHLNQLEKTYEEKVAILLRQLRGVKSESSSQDEEEQKMYAIQQEQIEERDTRLEEQQKTIEMLREKLKLIEESCNQRALLTPVSVAKKPTKPEPPKVTVNDDTFVMEEKENIEESDHSFIDEDNVDDDPDWRKTPLAKRMQEEKKRLTYIKPQSLDFVENGPSKRSSDGGCTCKTNCMTARCGCKKLGRSCGKSCRCGLTCENAEGSQEASTSSASTETTGEDSFKKPRIFNGTERNRKPRTKTRQLFKMNL